MGNWLKRREEKRERCVCVCDNPASKARRGKSRGLPQRRFDLCAAAAAASRQVAVAAEGSGERGVDEAWGKCWGRGRGRHL